MQIDVQTEVLSDVTMIASCQGTLSLIGSIVKSKFHVRIPWFVRSSKVRYVDRGKKEADKPNINEVDPQHSLSSSAYFLADNE